MPELIVFVAVRTPLNHKGKRRALQACLFRTHGCNTGWSAGCPLGPPAAAGLLRSATSGLFHGIHRQPAEARLGGRFQTPPSDLAHFCLGESIDLLVADRRAATQRLPLAACVDPGFHVPPPKCNAWLHQNTPLVRPPKPPSLVSKTLSGLTRCGGRL